MASAATLNAIKIITMNQFENSSQSYDFDQLGAAWLKAARCVQTERIAPQSPDMQQPRRATTNFMEVTLARRYYSSRQPLIRLVVIEAIRRGTTIGRMAAELGVTHGYLNQLENGTRRMDEISPKMVAKFAEVLNLPRLLVQYLAGKLTDDDLAELDSVGAKTADYLCELTERVDSQAREVLANMAEGLCNRNSPTLFEMASQEGCAVRRGQSATR
jgi:transcriptional regulator with XRE-family HTH domain